MKNLAYYNGRIAPIEEMTVPFLDRVCFFGDGVYDATHCVNYRIHLLDDHIDRFFRSAAALKIEIPLSKAELKALLEELVLKLDSHEQNVYFQVTRATAPRGHAFPVGVKANLWVMLTPGTPVDPKRDMKLITVEDTRFLHCDIKTLNLLPSIMAAQKAEEAGCDEAVFHRGEIVTECAHSNVHILKDGTLRTHPLTCHILPGIAREQLLLRCRDLSIPVVEEAFTLAELFDADEILVTRSGRLIAAASEIDGKPVGGKDPETLTRLIDAVMGAYQAACAPLK